MFVSVYAGRFTNEQLEMFHRQIIDVEIGGGISGVEGAVHLAAAPRPAQGISAELLHAVAAAQSLQEALVRGAAGAPSRHRRTRNERQSPAQNGATADD